MQTKSILTLENYVTHVLLVKIINNQLKIDLQKERSTCLANFGIIVNLSESNFNDHN